MCPIKNLCKGNATLLCMQYFNDGYLIKPKGDQSTIGRFQSWYYSLQYNSLNGVRIHAKESLG